MTEEIKLLREKVAAWVNGKKRSYAEGISLMEETGYKPNVLACIKKWGEGTRALRALDMELRNFLRFVVNPKNSIHQDIDSEGNSKSNLTPEQENEKVLGNIEKELSNEEYAPIIKQLLTEFSELYKGRSIFHRELKEVGDGNDDVSTGKRSRLAFVIDAMSRRMDILWPAFEAYKENGTLPEQTLFDTPFDPEKGFEMPKGNSGNPVEFVLADNLVDLKKQKENLRIKISKRNNLLMYQEERKCEKENPMPESPRRKKLEKELVELNKNKEAVEFKIVELQ